MSPADHDRVIYIARAAALEGVPLEDALDSHADELEPILAHGVTALEVIQVAEEEHAWLSGVVARAERRPAA